MKIRCGNQIVSIHMAPAPAAVLDSYCATMGMKRTDVFRMALFQFLDMAKELAPGADDSRPVASNCTDLK